MYAVIAMVFPALVQRFRDLSLRRKLVLSFLAVILIGGVLTLFVGTRIEHRTIISLAEAKVRHDLDAARMVYNEKLGSIRDIVRLTADRDFLRLAVQTGRLDGVAARLEAVRRRFGLDVLTLTDAGGRVAVRARRPELAGDDQSRDPFVAAALRGESPAGTGIVPRPELLKEGPELAERAWFAFVPTAIT